METYLQQRAQRVAALSAVGMTPARIRDTLVAEGIVNPVSGQPFSLSTIRRDLSGVGEIAAAPAEARVSEMIGRTSVNWRYSSQRQRLKTTVSVDKTRPDYASWDKLRRGSLKGFEIGGLFCRPITDTLTAFTIGKKLTFTLAEGGDAQDEEDPRTQTDKALEEFADENHPLIQMVVDDHYGLGDQFVVVNPDGTLSIPSPETVDWETDPLDYRKVVRVTITTRLDKALVTDTYTADARQQAIKWTADVYEDEATRQKLLHKMGSGHSESYANLLGEIPVVHFACEQSANEVFGHPVYQPLFRLLSRYDDLIEKALDGVELLGNPMPTFTGVEDVLKFIADLKTISDEFYTDADGNTDMRTVLNLDALPAVIGGRGVDFKMVAPDKGFTTDIVNMLKTLFILICYYAQIPEFAFGAGMDATRASTETQMPVLIQHIDLLRGRLVGDLKQVVRLWLKARQLTTPSTVVERVRVTFPEISLDSATVRMQKVIYAKGIGGLTVPRAVEELQLVADPNKDYQLAQQEAAQMQTAQDEYMTALNAAAHTERDPNAGVTTPQGGSVTSGKPPLPAGGRRAKMRDGKRVGEYADGKRKRKPRWRDTQPDSERVEAAGD